ncbi:MAG: oligosaccharide flippase family protein [Candidatus Aenigmatarchaeota archaeon]
MADKYRYADRIARGSALVFASTFITMGLGYLLRLFLTRALTVEEYGLLYAVVVFVNFFALFRDLGVSQALVKAMPEWEVRGERGKIYGAIRWAMSVQLLVGGCAAAAIFAAAPWLAEAYFHSSGAVALTQVMAGAFFVAIFGGVFHASLQGLQRIKAYASLQMANNLFLLAFTVLFVGLGFGIFGATAAYLAGCLAFGLAAGVTLSKVFVGRARRLNGDDKRKLLGFAFPVLLGFVGASVLGATDTMVLTYFRSLAEVGLYQAALPTSQILWSVASAIGIVLFPMVSEMWARKDKCALSAGISLLLRFSFMLVLPFALLMLAWPEFVLSMLFGHTYTGGAAALQVLALAALAYTGWQIVAVALSGIGKPGTVTNVVFAMAGVNLISNIVLVQIFGTVGVALTTLSVFLLGLGAAGAFLSRHIGLKVEMTSVMKTLFSGLIMLTIIFGLKEMLVLDPWIEVAVSLFAGIVVYTVLVLRLRAVSKAELEMVGRLAVPLPKLALRIAQVIAG